MMPARGQKTAATERIIMRWITAQHGQLQTLLEGSLESDRGKTFSSGLEALDELAPGGAWNRGAVHEFLSEGGMVPAFPALLIARAAIKRPEGEAAIIWCDPLKRFYPPAAAALGVPLRRLYLLHTAEAKEQLWAIGQCLRCGGVGATVAALGRLSQLEARRLQLAAEAGGGIGVLLRPAGSSSRIYAAATRWLVSRAAGDNVVQRWRLQLVHGHGGRVGEGVYLEHSRETNLVRATFELADRSYPAARPAQPARVRVA